MSINRATDAQDESIHTKEHYSVTKGHSTGTRDHMDTPQTHYTKPKKPEAKAFRAYDSISMKYAEKTNLQRQRAVHWLPGTKNRNIDWLKTGSRECWEVMECSFFFSKKKRFYLFIFRKRGREGEREGEKHQCFKRIMNWLPRAHPQLGTKPTTQFFALTGSQNGNLLVCGMTLNPLSHTGQGEVMEYPKTGLW